MTYDTYFTFCIAAAALAFVPGPTVTVIIANSLRYGAKAGLLNVAGTQAGVMIWLTIAAVGLSAAIQVMGAWFDALRWAGTAEEKSAMNGESVTVYRSEAANVAS